MTDEIRKVQNFNVADYSSLNGYGVVTLEDGQQVNVQFTMRHAMTSEQMLKDYGEYVAFLNAISSQVKFWDGNRGSKSEKTSSQASNTDAKMDWMRDGNGQPVVDKGKMILLVDGGADALPEDFKIDCPLHSGKRLFLNTGKYGRFLGHKMDSGGFCNANIHAMVDPQEDERPF